MVVRYADMKIEDRNVCDGEGLCTMKDIAFPEQMYEKSTYFGHCVIHPGCSFGLHSHEHETEIYYVLKGEGLYNDNGKEIKVYPGDTMFCKDAEHSIANAGSEDFEMIALIILE